MLHSRMLLGFTPLLGVEHPAIRLIQ
jgi:hypothetical protein